ncbi:MAG: poly-gamma-glutamate synthase PgsB [Anaerolineaceae bacterium]|nr:poly-gamma-glutamate synthase PgsB [Anaerolineaceae bacterium]
MFSVYLLGSILTALVILWAIERWRYDKRIGRLKLRVHVNGIRGKSTVTRLVAGVLREAGYQTVAKTTGSAAQVILPNGDEVPILRQSAPTIIELLNTVIRFTDEETEAIVFETMALQPNNQIASQKLLVRGNITIITNIREDHQDVMGETLEQIADTLSLTIPENGYLITAEERPELRARLEKNAAARGSTMIYADPAQVQEKDLSRFSYVSFRENVAIGFVLADLLGIPRTIALQGMCNARPDPGVVEIQHTRWNGKEIIWAPLFAVNDRESAIIGVDTLLPFTNKQTTRIGILNNRYDRADRAWRFAKIAIEDLHFDYLITFGAYESQVTQRMVSMGYPRERIINLGFSVNPSLHQIFDTVAGLIQGEQGILVGMVNIHTPQAELIIEYFNHQPDAPMHTNDEAARQIFRPRNEVLKKRMAHIAARQE